MVVDLFVKRPVRAGLQTDSKLRHALGLGKFKGTLQGNDPVEHQIFIRGILGIHAEETVSHELEAVVSLRTLEVRLQIAVFYDGQRIGIQVQGTVLIVNTLALIDNVLIETALSLDGGGSIYPMNGTFYFSAVRCVSALGLGIVSGMDHSDVAILVLLAAGAGHKVSVHKT